MLDVVKTKLPSFDNHHLQVCKKHLFSLSKQGELDQVFCLVESADVATTEVLWDLNLFSFNAFIKMTFLKISDTVTI